MIYTYKQHKNLKNYSSKKLKKNKFYPDQG